MSSDVSFSIYGGDPGHRILAQLLQKVHATCVVVAPGERAPEGSVAVILDNLGKKTWILEGEPGSSTTAWAQTAAHTITVNVERTNQPKGLYQNLREAVLRRATGLRANTGKYGRVSQLPRRSPRRRAEFCGPNHSFG